MTDDYRPPLLRVGDRVIISADPTWSDPLPGRVSAVQGLGADVIADMPGRAFLFRDSLYFDDPRVVTRPHLFEDEDRGVFRLAEAELEQRAIVVELGEQRAMLEALAVQIALLERKPGVVDTPPKDAPSRRGPGRPRRPKPEEEEEPVVTPEDEESAVTTEEDVVEATA